MNIDNSSLIEVGIAAVGGLFAIGTIAVRFAIHSIEMQHKVTRNLIEERFVWAETQRQEAREHWEAHFRELRRDDERLEKRLDYIETRVNTIETQINHTVKT